MKEEFLHYLWRTHKWINSNLRTTDHRNLEVIYPGDYNEDQGPDFSYAKLSIDGTVWIGQVEMHLSSSDWIRHNHSIDAHYHNVILHVVWIHDEEIIVNGNVLPTLELKKYITDQDVIRYKQLIECEDRIPCEKLFANVPSHLIISQMENVSIHRLQQKTLKFKKELESTQQDWEEVFYKNLCKYLVTPPNADSMEVLTTKISWRLIQKIKSELTDLEALFFGVAGMLNASSEESYVLELQNRYTHHVHKYNLSPMKVQNWHFLRLRPSHFPSLRLAQLASFFHSVDRPLAYLLEITDLAEARKVLIMEPSDYWRNHYQLGRPSTQSGNHRLGNSTKDVLFINVVIPLIYMYGIQNSNESQVSKALNWLEIIKSENNIYTRLWRELGFKAENARHSQACIQQYKIFCQNKKCLECKIGHYILSQG